MKEKTETLPPIMREYCDFILSVGEKTELMAKMVSDYTLVILKGIEETEAELSKAFRTKGANVLLGSEWGKMERKGDTDDDLNILFR